MKKILIVDDDLMMQKIVADIVHHHLPEYHILGAVSSVADALEVIKSDSPDLLILDIELSDGTAFDLLRKVEFYDFKVVFLSGHDNYQREAIQFSAVGYVSKPFEVSDLVISIDRACEAIDEAEYQRKIEILLTNAKLPAISRMVIFPTAELDEAVSLSSVLYGEAVPGGCVMHLDTDRDIYVPRPLRRYEQLFGNYGFVRCHPLYVVNLRKIESLDEQNTTIYLENGRELPMEPRKYEIVKQKYYEIVP
jgi:two-component system LytT family response regulator